jgi:antitoxin component of MazEF toxin-antitoxin module
MIKLTVIDHEGEAALVLPEDALTMLNARLGDEVILEETSGGQFVLITTAPSHEGRVERGRAFLSRYEPTFRALAK